MAGFYNAVIRDDPKILGRTLLRDPRHVPWWWEIRDWTGKEIVSVKDLNEPFDMKKDLLEPIYPEKLLQIVKRKRVRDTTAKTAKASQKEFEIIFPLKDITTTTEVRLKVKGSHTLQDLRWMVSREKGVPEPSLWGLALGDTTLWNKLHLTMNELGASPRNNLFRYLPRSQLPVNKTLDLNEGNADVQVMYSLPFGGYGMQGQRMWTFDRVEHAKRMIWKQHLIPVKEQRLSYNGAPITKDQDHLSFQQLEKGRVSDETAVYSYFFRLEESEIPGVVLVSQRINFTTGEVANPEDNWRAYAPGLNLKGSCANPKCKSRNETVAKDSVIVPMGFSNRRSFVLLAAWRVVHECPACGKDMFKPNSYLLAGARCAVVYKLPGDRFLKPFNYATNSAFPKGLVFQDPKGMKKFEYVEMRVTPWDQSPHDCFWCGLPIGKLEDEVTQEGCGHYWHNRCSLRVTCAICEAELVEEANLKNVCK